MVPIALADLSLVRHSTGEKLMIKPGTTITLFSSVKTEFHVQRSRSLTDVAGFPYACKFQNEIPDWDFELV